MEEMKVISLGLLFYKRCKFTSTFVDSIHVHELFTYNLRDDLCDHVTLSQHSPRFSLAFCEQFFT